MRAPDTSYCTRSSARMLGLKNMWPGGGLMCCLMVTQIICDMIDSKFVKGSIFQPMKLEHQEVDCNNELETDNGMVTPTSKEWECVVYIPMRSPKPK